MVFGCGYLGHLVFPGAFRDPFFLIGGGSSHLTDGLSGGLIDGLTDRGDFLVLATHCAQTGTSMYPIRCHFRTTF